MNDRITVVDDEAKILRFIKANLLSFGYDVTSCLSGVELLEKIDLMSPDLILLDVMMPNLDGFQTLEQLRKFSSVPVIILTARSNPQDKVTGLNLGADDYLTKPFSLDELSARVRAVLRRTKPLLVSKEASSEMTVGPMRINFGQKRIWIEGEEAKFTSTEYFILELLAIHLDKVLSHEQILTAVWGSEYRDDVEYVRVAIARIRKKLKELYVVTDKRKNYIVTYPGIGYMLTTNPI